MSQISHKFMITLRWGFFTIPIPHILLIFGPLSSQFTRQFLVFCQINCFYEYDPFTYGWYCQLFNERYIYCYELYSSRLTTGPTKRPSAKDLCKPPWRFGLQPPLQGLITAAVGPKVHLQKYVPKLGMHITEHYVCHRSVYLSGYYHLVDLYYGSIQQQFTKAETMIVRHGGKMMQGTKWVCYRLWRVWISPLGSIPSLLSGITIHHHGQVKET